MGHMQSQLVKTTVEIDSRLFYLAKMKALQEKKSLKEIINQSLTETLGFPDTKTIDLLTKIQEIVQKNQLKKSTLQQSATKIRKQLVTELYP